MSSDSQTRLAEARHAAVAVVGALASALGGLLRDTAWEAELRTVKDLQRVTGFSHRAAWQIHRVGHAEEALAEVRHMPKRPAFQRLCEAARAAGAAADALDEAERAFEAFQEFVRSVAGDRETFAVMAESWCGRADSETATPYLRQAFRANQHIWGIASKASFMTCIALPEPDWVLLRGHCSLRSSRRNAWDVSVFRGQEAQSSRPLELVSDPETRLVGKYCRGPLPELDHRVEGDYHITRATFDASGDLATHTLVFGERNPVEGRDNMRARLLSAFPMQRMMVDVLAHRSLGPRLAHHDFYASYYAAQASNSRRLPTVPVQVIQRDNAVGSIAMRELSTYGDLLEESLGLFQRSLSEFALFRITCEYPPTGGILHLGLDFDPEEASQ